MASDVIMRIKAVDDGASATMQKLSKNLQDAKRENDAFIKTIKGGATAAVAYATAIAGVNSASEIFRKVIDSSQSATDEWGRTMAACTSAVDTFFESLIQGNFDRFLTGLGDMITKARDAYDAMDALGSLNIVANYRIQKIRTEQAELRRKIRYGEGDTEAHKKRLRETQSEMDSIVSQQVESTRAAALAQLKAVTGADDRQAKKILDAVENNPNLLVQDVVGQWAKDLEKENPYLSGGQVSLEKLGSSVGWAQTAYGVGMNLIKTDPAVRSDYNVYTAFSQSSDPKLQSSIDLFLRTKQLEESNSSRKVEQLETLNYKRPVINPPKDNLDDPELEIPKDFSPLRFNKTKSKKELKTQLSAWQGKLDEATTWGEASRAQEMIDNIRKELEIQPIALRLEMSTKDVATIKANMDSLTESIRNSIKPLEITPGGEKMFKPLEDANKEVKDISGGVNATVGAFGNLGAAMQSLEDPSAQVAGLVMQAVANVAATFAKSLAGTVTPWDWIAAAIAGTATMISTITAIKSATSGSYADGGVVSGNSRMGDAIPVMANAGEVILNASQQQNLAAQLEPRDERGGSVRSVISGEQIVTVVNAYGRRTHRGEILT